MLQENGADLGLALKHCSNIVFSAYDSVIKNLFLWKNARIRTGHDETGAGFTDPSAVKNMKLG